MTTHLARATFAKLSPRPLSKYSVKEIRFSGKRAIVRKLVIGWQAYRNMGDPARMEMDFFDTWEEAIRWALEKR